MTITEIRNLFTIKYKIECAKRGIKEFDIQDKIVASLISEAQREIADRLKILVTYQDISVSAATTFTTYKLNTNYLKVDRVESLTDDDRVIELNEVPISSIPTMGDLSEGTPGSFAVFFDVSAGRYKITFYPLPDADGTIRVWYYVDPGLYSPSDSSLQDWGTFDGSTFTGDLKIPKRFIPLLITNMLGAFFDEKKQEFEVGLIKEKGNRSNSTRQGTTYNLGGYSADEY